MKLNILLLLRTLNLRNYNYAPIHKSLCFPGCCSLIRASFLNAIIFRLIRELNSNKQENVIMISEKNNLCNKSVPLFFFFFFFSM